MRVLYFGTYSKEEGYPRNKVIIDGLRRNGVDVTECHSPLWRGAEEKIAGIKMGIGFLRFLPRLIFAYLILIIKFIKIGGYDLIVVGYSGHIDIFLAKFLNIFRRKPLVFDAFLSLYDTGVLDRGVVRKNSLKAKILWWVDRISCSLADMVLLDTEEHIRFFVETFNLLGEKFYRVFAGAEEAFLKGDREEKLVKNERFEVLFFGTFIPLHGVETIIRAARLLEDNSDIHFTLIGRGQLSEEAHLLAERLGVERLTFIDRWVSSLELKGYIDGASLCLGVFGTTDKAKRVIPYKVYGYLSLGKAVITGDTPAIKELLKDGETAILVPLGDPSSIAEAILKLKRDDTLSEKIGNNAFRLFNDRCSPEVVGRDLKVSLENLIAKTND